MDSLFALLSTHFAKPWWAYVVTYVPWMLLVFVIERLLAAQRPDAAAAWFNLRFIAGALLVNVVLLDAGRRFLQPATELLSPWFASARNLPQQWPVWLRFLLFVAVLDFFYYWTHRAQHRFAALWRIHELHHSDPSFNVTTTLRVHWLEELMKLATVLLPAAWLVQPPVGVPLGLAWLGAVWLFFIHANARVSYGWFNQVLVSPAVHRIHHSTQPEHHDKNFAAYFSFWDRLFGTYVAPTAGHWPAVGTAGEPPRSTWAAHLRPFRRRKVDA